MGKLEKKIDSVTEALERCMLVAQGAVSLKGLNIDKLFSGKAMEKSAKDMGKKLSDDLIKNFNLNLAGKDVAGQVKSLSNKIANSLANSAGKPYKGAADDMEALGNIVKRHGQIAKTTSDEYQELYNWIKKSGKIKISPETAKSLGDDYKNRTPVAKQKFSTKGGIELDSYYQELKDQFPTILKEAYSVEDEFYQMENALRKFYETANSFYKPEWMEEDVWDSVINGVDDIRKSVINAKSGVTEFGDALQNAEESGRSFSQLFGANINTSGLDKAEKKLHSVSRVAQPKAKSKNLSLDDLFEKHSKVGTDLDVTGMSVKELQAGLKSATSSAERLNASLEKKLATQRSKELGVQIEGLVYDIQKATNQAEIFREALAKLPGSKPFEISTAKDVDTSGGGYEQKVTSVPEEAMNYDASAMRAVYGEGAENLKNFNDVMDRFGGTAQEAFEKLNNGTNSLNTNKINTYEAQIKRLNAELEDMAKRGLTQGDPEYDRVMREKIEIAEAKRLYEKSMKEQAREDLGANEAKKAAQALKEANKRAEQFQRTLKKTAGFSNRVNNLAKALKNVGKTMKNARDIANKAAHPFRTLKELMGFESKKKNNGMPFGRMIGSSIMFSTIFGLISQIKQAIKEGSDNLVQYSGSYNNSISSMVSSLLYLKNAWAVAFAPIVNVVAPYISSFIDMVSSALNAVGHFLAALTGKGYVVQAKKAWKNYASGLDTTKDSANGAEKALKDLQNYTLGIDELNVIQPNDNGSSSGSSGSGSGASSPSSSDMFETIEVSNSMNQLADKFKEAIKNSDFTEIGKMVGDKLNAAMESIPWDEIYHKADNFGKDLATFLNGLISPELFYNVGATAASSINTALHSLNSFAANFDWSNFGASLASSITGFFETWDAKLTGETFGNFVSGVLEALKGAIDGLQGDKTFEIIGQKIVDFICGIDWGKIAWDLSRLLVSLANAIINLPNDLLRGIAIGFFTNVFDMSEEEVKMKLPKFVLPSLSGLGLAALGSDIIKGVLEGITENSQPLLDFFTDLKGKIVEKFDDVKDWFGDKFGKAREAISEKFSDVGTWFGNKKTEIQDNTKDVDTWMNTKYTSARKYVNTAFTDVGTWFGKRKSDVQTNMDSISTWFKTKYQEARSNVNSAFLAIGSWFGLRRKEIEANMSSIATWFGDVFRRAYNGITAIFDNIGSYFEKVGGWISTPIKNALNGVRKAVNWIYGKLGGKGDLIEAFATGTGGNGVTKDTIGMVNDQAGGTYRELVQFPNGRTIIPTGRNIVLPMPKGTKVLPAGKTKELMQTRNIPHFKNGIGDFFGGAWAKFKDFTGNVFSYITNPGKLVQLAIDHFTNLSGAIEPGLSMAKGAVNTVFDLAVDKVKGLFTEFGQSNVSYNASKGVQQWADLAEKALRLTNQYSVSNLNALLMQMQHESGGNPNAINLWDSNAKKGIPSKGLMQVIDPTFRSYAMSPYDSNIYDPLSNMVAAIRYTVSRYGSLYRGWTARGYKGYKNGGMPVNGEVYIANENGFGSEYIGRMGSNHVVANNQQIVQSVSSGVERANDETNALLRQIIDYQERLLKKDSSVRIDSKKVNRQLSRGSRNSGYSFSTV
nr:MAG TPA: minor tail protein [Bacteriophage sp.]